MAYSTTGLPVIPYTLTTVIDGIKYETHVLTNTCQVITEDGVTLCDVLKGLVTSEELNKAIEGIKPEAGSTDFRYKGVLNNLPDKSAIEQLFEKIGAQTGDVYLVQISNINCHRPEHVPNLAYDMYCWIEKIATWVWIGSTQRDPDLYQLPLDTLKKIPATVGNPGEILMTAADGKTLIWGSADGSTDIQIEQHNVSPEAHQDIRAELAKKGDKLKIFNAVIHRVDWYWDGSGAYYTYVFKDERLAPHTYFELTPIATKKDDLDVLKKAAIQPIYNIDYNESTSYATLHCKHIPTADIRVCVKEYGDYEDI